MRLTKPRSLTGRLLLAAGFWCTCLLIVGGLLLSNLFRSAVERNFDTRLNVLLESLVAASDFKPAAGLGMSRALSDPRFDRAYSGWYWQIVSPDGTALRSRSLWDAELVWPTPVLHTADRTVPSTGPNGEALRLLARVVRLPGIDAGFHYAVAGATDEMENERRRFNQALILSLTGLGAGLLATLILLVKFGLSPLGVVSRALAAIRAGERERLEGVFPAEIQPLASELNALLAQNASVVDRARTHVGNLAHGLKTPLSVLRNSASELPEPLASSVEHQLDLMQRQIDHYLVRARAAGPVGLSFSRTPVDAVIEDLRRTLAKLHREDGLDIQATVEAGLHFAGDRQDLEEVLGNVMDNACKWARSTVQIRARRLGATGRDGSTEPGAGQPRVEIQIDDDGPGLPASRREAVLERGKRLDESTPGSGLGLDIVRDIVSLYAGEIRLEDAPLGGLRLRLELPAAP